MNCPECASANTRTDSTIKHDTCILRRRVCKDCGHKFLTEEVAVKTPVVRRGTHKHQVSSDERESA